MMFAPMAVGPVPDNPLGQRPLIVQRCNHMKGLHPKCPRSPGNIVQVQIGDRGGHRIAMLIDDRVVNQRNVQIEPG